MPRRTRHRSQSELLLQEEIEEIVADYIFRARSAIIGHDMNNIEVRLQLIERVNGALDGVNGTELVLQALCEQPEKPRKHRSEKKGVTK